MKKVIFFISSPLYKRDIIKYGYKILKTNNYEVSFYNFGPILFPKMFTKAKHKSRYQGKNQKIFFSKDEALLEISKINSNCFIFCTIHYNFKTHSIFRAISKLKLSYGLSTINLVPNNDNKVINSETIFKKISNIQFSLLHLKLLGRVFKYNNAKMFGIKSPDVIIAGGANSINSNKFDLADKNTNVLWTHTYDYDTYLRNIKLKRLSLKKIAVFIDAPSPMFSHDSLIPGVSSPLTVEKYYPSLCKFFDLLEETLKLKVIIAAHPKSQHAKFPKYFGGREVIYNKTSELIRISSLVINRNSTSINFAILYNKPLIFHTTEEIENSIGMRTQIESMSSAVGKKPINIDKLNNIDWDKLIKIDKRKYSNYKNLYIKKSRTSNKMIWQSLSDWLKDK